MSSRAYATIAASLFTATSALAQNVAPPGAHSPLAALARASAATVTIEVQGACCVASGSGLLMTQTGLIATSAHIIAGAQRVRVRLSTGELFDAVGMVSYEPQRDLALIVIPGVGLPSAPLANSDNVAVGQRVFAIGVPPGVGTTVTNARLSAVRTEDGVRWLQVSVRVSSSANGGPLVNEQGDVVGLVVAGARGGAERFNAVLPINDVRGEAGRLAGKTPTPFGAMAHEETVYPLVGGPSAGDLPFGAAAGRARTTPDLDLDFRPLNGVVLVFEEEYAGHLRVRDSTGYFLSLTPDGSLGVQRTNRREWRDPSVSAPLAEQRLLTTYDIGYSDRSSSVFTLRPLVSEIPTDSWEVHIEAGRYRFRSAAGVREGEATPGTVPREMLSAIVAALPDSLPPEVRVWVLDAVANRSEEVIVQFGRRESRMIPVPGDGSECGAGIPTRNVAVDVVLGTRRTGMETVSVVVLARRPHVILGGAALSMTSRLKCVVIPGVVP